MKTGFIYCIKDGNIVLYVGASYQPEVRFSFHKKSTLSEYNVQTVLSLHILEECSKNSIGIREIYWIKHFENEGHSLFNKGKNKHNGKWLDKDTKNIRISINTWRKIKIYCAENSLLMGPFVEMAAIDKMNHPKSKQ